jgi:hypothetical protein
MLLSTMDMVENLRRPEGKTLEFKRDPSSPEGALRMIVAVSPLSAAIWSPRASSRSTRAIGRRQWVG